MQGKFLLTTIDTGMDFWMGFFQFRDHANTHLDKNYKKNYTE